MEMLTRRAAAKLAGAAVACSGLAASAALAKPEAGPSASLSEEAGGDAPAAGPAGGPGSPELLRAALEEDGFVVQDGRLYEFDTLRLASEGKLMTCFGNNAGSTYLILDLPPAPGQAPAPGERENSAAGPGEQAWPANPSFSPAGMQFKLRQDEAVIVCAPLPGPCKYWSFIAYDMFTAQVEGKDYSREKGFFSVGDEESGLYHTVFASIGSPVNMLGARHSGDSPFGGWTVLLLCANAAVRDAALSCLEAAGYGEGMVNVMEVPTGVYRMGLERGRDTFSLFGRVSQPEDRAAFDEYMDALPGTAVVLRATPRSEAPAEPFPVRELPSRGSGVHEAARLEGCTEHLERLRAAILARYADEYDYEELSSDIAFADGLTSYLNDANAQGDVHDAAYLMTGDLALEGEDDFVVVYGVNHAFTGKARYFNAVLHERPMVNGVCSVYDSMLSGSADDLLGEESPGYYAYKMARRDEDGRTAVIPYATGNEQGRYYGIDDGSPAFVLFRIYLDETGVGASYYELVNDRAIVFHKRG